MMPIENIQEFRSVGSAVGASKRFFLRTVCMPLASGQSGRTRGLQTERSFSMMHDFRQSLEPVGLPQVSKMLRQLTGQISAYYSCSKIRKTHLRLFRPDQGPHAVLTVLKD